MNGKSMGMNEALANSKERNLDGSMSSVRSGGEYGGKHVPSMRQQPGSPIPAAKPTGAELYKPGDM